MKQGFSVKTRLSALALALALVLALTLWGCAGTAARPDPAPTDRVPVGPTVDPVPTDRVPGGPAVDLLAGYARTDLGREPPTEEPGLVDFGLTLLRESAEDGENALVSPLSVLTALAMTANGAREETLAQLETALGLPIDRLNDWLDAYSRGMPHMEGCDLEMANALWLREDPELKVEETFLEAVSRWYEAGVYKAPFDSGTVDAINAWVAGHTKDRIREILRELSPEAVLCLVNALSFDGVWAHPYDEWDVREGEFTAADGGVREVDMMWSTESNFLEGEGVTGFVRPYEGGRMAFLALLPDEGTAVEEILASLTGEELARMLEQRGDRRFRTYAALPKFKSEYAAELNAALARMGAVDAFDPDRADFSAMGSYGADGRLFIGQVLHKTFLEVDESGTKAAAATAVTIVGATAVMDPVEYEEHTVVLDRPFLYGIVDLATGLPVFLGVMADPG